MNYIIVSSRSEYYSLPQELSETLNSPFHLIRNMAELTQSTIQQINPKYIFIPHWSHRIPSEIYENFECIIFHMTDVPFGRGGSPLQNLIRRGIYETQMSALKCVSEIDAGPVYLKRPLSLNGSATDVFLRATSLIKEMIISIINHNPIPQDQQGEVTHFRRLTPSDGTLSTLQNLTQVYDTIRMLDAPGYPPAFLETSHLKLEFDHASLKEGEVIAHVRITQKTT